MGFATDEIRINAQRKISLSEAKNLSLDEKTECMILDEIHIKQSTESDFNDIMEVEKAAFSSKNEASLVADLLKDKTAEPIISLLAFHHQKAIGHILFTRLYLENIEEPPLIHILAPMAVIPEFQKEGIGALLIKTGLEILKKEGSKMVFVLGHMDYYPKHGFIPDAANLGYPAPYPIPEELKNAWMVQALTEDGFEMAKGKIRCADELNKEELWSE